MAILHFPLHVNNYTTYTSFLVMIAQPAKMVASFLIYILKIDTEEIIWGGKSSFLQYSVRTWDNDNGAIGFVIFPWHHSF